MRQIFNANRFMVLLASGLCLVFLLSSAQPALGQSKVTSPLPTLPTPPPVSANPTFVARQPVGIAGATSATGASSISEDDIRRFVTSHNIPGNMGGSQSSVILVLKLPIEDITGRLGGSDSGLPKGTMMWYVELRGQFIFPGSSQQPDGIPYPIAFEVFFASNGNLLMEGGLPTSTATNPTPTPVAAASPTAAPSPTPAPQATATNTPTPTCTPFNNGTTMLNVDTGYFDFDTAAGTSSIAAQPGSDLHYTSAAAQQFTPINGAAVRDLGKVGFASVSCATIRNASYGAGSIPTVDGDVFLVKTNGGHFAVVLVQNPAGSHDIITIQLRTYTVS